MNVDPKKECPPSDKRPDTCPACGSNQIVYVAAAQIGSDCEHAGCRECRAIWEAFPPLYHEDEVAAEPCDNCAFRPGSPEQNDPEKWKELIASLKPDPITGWFTGQFYCHKNVPIDQEAGPGNFLFPKRQYTHEVEGETISHTDFDIAAMRSCSGFLRMLWAQNRKSPKPGAEGGAA